jgi:glycosyltransferase involved in cell wall biosynthesis
VVASATGGIPEACGGAAWLVSPEDPEGAVRALRGILSGTEDTKDNDIEARRRRRASHALELTWAACAARVEELYHEILGG